MTRPGRDVEASPGLRFAPLAAYLLVYTGTCLIGAAVLLSGYRPFVALYEYFSGSRVPSLTTAEKETGLALLLASPVLTAAGFTAATRRLRPATHRPADTWTRWTGLVAFAICASAALTELICAGAFSHLASWLDYGDWVVVRETLFRRIGFAGFADIYVLVPTSAAWVAASELHRGKRGLVVSLAACATAAALSLLLFQKRPALAAAIIVVTAALLSTRHRVSRRSIRIRTLVAASMLVLVYFALLVVPVVSKTSKTIHQAVRRSTKLSQLSETASRLPSPSLSASSDSDSHTWDTRSGCTIGRRRSSSTRHLRRLREHPRQRSTIHTSSRGSIRYTGSISVRTCLESVRCPTTTSSSGTP